MSSQEFDAIIIGAGASGLFCAFHTALYGKQVLVLDHANKAGKKILMSGGGRCNFVNLHITPNEFVGQNRHFVKSALSRYGSEDFIKLVQKHGIAYHEKSHGELFCDESSKDILNMLLDECADAGVEIRLNTSIDGVVKDEQADRFVLSVCPKNAKPYRLGCRHLIIATGGLSIPTLGASGFGYQVATQFGHTIVPTEASLVPFTFTDKVGELARQLAGVSLDVIAFNDKASFALPMLFTHRGLSGPAMLQLSNYWQLGETIGVNLLPTHDVATLLVTAKKSHPKQLIRTVLSPYFPKKLLMALQELFWQAVAELELANIKDKQLKDIGRLINAWQIKPSGTEGYRVAEVTRGGVNTDEIKGKTMESKCCSGLYFIGEVLDVAGHLGGFNFMWAWASAYACSEAVGMDW
ncbi:NAD(P)/FAD-dependent oxidoreductase [Moraxella nasibovis]|uniref:NAD(P)/FAD-dependent oxidoreductase n=1 Tax=Moraxella nasibovis TaxID=2904120 RepID=UPI00240F50BF|nr:NAD(P)/FAD-dependent oxidoreductase [Moraxella nasibovis]WFF39738.1 NAD(P)/FAD-dependent oxidoreductase [Moraxella nasibovis]